VIDLSQLKQPVWGTVFLALAKRPGVKSGEREPTRQGYAIPSEGMANLFQDHFERYWKSPEALPYEVYVKELVSEITRMNVGISPDVVSRQLRIPDEEARSYMI
jgi:hypothetical protein